MRSLPLLAVLSVVAALPPCQRRNQAFCQEPEYPCEAGLVCVARRCVAPECGGERRCPADRPVCTGNLCGPCTDGDDDELCAARGAEAPYCRSGRCVACLPEPLRNRCGGDQPVCDPERYVCRACERHAECASGVCAKDDLLAGLPGGNAIRPGACVPRERVLVVDTDSCRQSGMPCSPSEALMRVSEEQPYILLRKGPRLHFGNLRIENGQPALSRLHIIGPLADTSPARMNAIPQVELGVPGQDAIFIGPGYKVVLEGLLLRGGQTGVRCKGRGAMAAPGRETEVRVLGSIIGQNDVGLSIADACHLTLSKSWVGRGTGVLATMLGNVLAMDIQNTDFAIVNSVLFSNGNIARFGGIKITDLPGRKSAEISHILNSTLVGHYGEAASGALTIECNIELSARLAILNTYLLNEVMSPGQTHISQVCRPFYSQLAANPDWFTTDKGGVAVMRVEESGMVDVARGGLGLLATAPEAIAEGGKDGFMVSTTEIRAPSTDIEDQPRGRRRDGRVSIGAFEAPWLR